MGGSPPTAHIRPARGVLAAVKSNNTDLPIEVTTPLKSSAQRFIDQNKIFYRKKYRLLPYWERASAKSASERVAEFRTVHLISYITVIELRRKTFNNKYYIFI